MSNGKPDARKYHKANHGKRPVCHVHRRLRRMRKSNKPRFR